MKQSIFDLKVPNNDTIKSRTSTVAKSLATSVIPRIDPLDWELEIAKKILRFDNNGKPLCTYCGKPATEWDHLNPLINKKKPTGYITEIANLVPCCRSCNGSKRGKPWREWLENNTDITEETKQESIRILTRYSTELPPIKLEYDKIKGFKAFWDSYYNGICKQLQKAECAAKGLLSEVDDAIRRQLSPEKRITRVNNKFNVLSIDGKNKLLNKNAGNIEIIKSTQEADDGAEYVSDEMFLLQFGKKYGVLTLDDVIVTGKYDNIEVGDDYLCGIISGKEYYVTPGERLVEYDQDPPADAIRFVDRYDYDPSMDY